MYEQARAAMGKQTLTVEHFAHLEEDAQWQYSLHRITSVIKAAKEDKKFNWDMYSERKWYPWWDMETYEGQSAGSGFAFGVCVCADAITGVGSRLCSFSEEQAKHIALVMIDDYRNFIKE